MTALYVALWLTFGGGGLLALTGSRPRLTHVLNVLITLGTLISTLVMARTVLDSGALLATNQQFYVDAFNVYLIVLTAFVGFTTSVFSGPYMTHERHKRQIPAGRMRLYYLSFQGFLGAMMLALSTNNLGILWVALEGATLGTVLLVSFYRTPTSIEAAWKYFVLCGVGIAQALFGTVLIYFTATQIGLNADDALLWSHLSDRAHDLEPVILSIAFVFILVGYGTKVGLVPLHNWLPDAHSEGPTPISAVLSGLLLNVGLYAVVRIKMLADTALGMPETGYWVHMPGYLMMGFGLVSFIVAGLFLHKQQDIKRLFSYSSIEHMGLITFAFGMGGPLATFAALLHMAVHSLTKSAIFVTVGHATQIAGTQAIDRIRGLYNTQPLVGGGLLLGTAAIAGIPPFGVFTSEFLLLSATLEHWPWLSVMLLMGLGVAFAGLFRNVQPMVFGEVPEGQQPVRTNMFPVVVHLLLVLGLGLSIPDALAGWFDQATLLISGGRVL
ncbi:MAG: hydrogenase 4 subunit F [Gammaproteobacteria bacterium]|nr:MAG: hydrogenase 4 subunit F [Gammaproteobacteria bacterium]